MNTRFARLASLVASLNSAKYSKYTKFALPLGFGAFYLFCLLLFATLTFPYDKLKERIVASFNAEQPAGTGRWELQIEEMHGYWFSGLRAKGIHLLSMPTEAGAAPSRIDIDEATARYGLLSKLVGNSSIGFRIYAFGGETTGSYSVHGKDKSIDVAIDAVDIGEVGPLVGLLGVPLKGKLAGTVLLEMPEGKASKGSGAVSLSLKDVAVGDGKAKLKGALALPRIDVGTVTFSGDAKDGTLKVTKLAAGGKDLELQGEGRIAMREQAMDSLADLQVRFKINDGYRNKSDLTKSLFGAPGSPMPALFELDPKVKQSKRPDGSYGWALRGPLSRPDFAPTGGGAGVPGAVGGGVPGSPGFGLTPQ
jgi:type II secretion system protein N